jgi:hypothetical protein
MILNLLEFFAYRSNFNVDFKYADGSILWVFTQSLVAAKYQFLRAIIKDENYFQLSLAR